MRTGDSPFWKAYALALGAGFVVTALLVSLAWTKAVGDRQQLFEVKAAQIWQGAFQKIENSNEALESVSALYLSSIEVSKEQFQGFAGAILARHSFIKTIVYLPRVAGPERTGLETRLHEEGFFGFSISKKGPNGREPAAEAADYFPVFHVAPFDVDNTALLGFDALSDPSLGAAIRKAIEVATPVPGAGEIAEGQRGYWIFKAIYAGTEVPADATDRRNLVNGVVAFLIAPDEFLDQPQLPEHITARINFGPATARSANTAPPPVLPDTSDIVQSMLAKRFDVSFPGYSFSLTASRPMSWRDNIYGITSFALLAGLSITFALLVFARGIALREKEQALRAEEIEREVQNKTRDLNESNERTRMMIENTLDSVVTIDAQGCITDWNPRSEVIFGWSREEAIGRVLAETIVPLRYRDAHQQGLARFLQGGEARMLNRLITLSAMHRDGHEFPVELSISAVSKGGAHTFTAFLRDITERKQAEERLATLASYDTLTGLPNRALFMDRLNQSLITQARYADHIFGLMFLDLDRFKSTNDTLGHAVGDKLLQAAAERIKGCLRKSDTVARLGGDEFTVILERITNATDSGIVAQKIIDAINKPFQIEDNEIFISASIGITICPHDARNAQDLLRNADTAMYQAKEQGKGRYILFTPEMNHRISERALLEKGLRRALERNEFLLHYQPQVDLASGRMIGMEALIRWQPPDHGMISPLQFIPLAEETGLIVPIGEWVLREACAQTQAWLQAGFPPLRVAVNLSGRQFKQQDLISTLNRILGETGLAADQLELEITESLAMGQADKTIRTLIDLKAMGIKLAIDDFGTGYSSLSYLKRFPIDTIKIDRSFVKDLTDDPDDAAITSAIIAMAHSLKLKVVAEGVETTEQRAFLQKYGCDDAQGYYFSKPLPGDVFGQLLKKTPLQLP